MTSGQASGTRPADSDAGSDPRPGVTPAGVPRSGVPRGSLVRRLLGVPLFWKIFLANVALVALGVVAGALLLAGIGPVGTEALATIGVATGALVLLASVLVNAWLVSVALSPLESLVDTARRVRSGDLEARSAASAVSDASLSRVVEVFNDMLDSLWTNRNRQLELARRVLESEERERQRIAHELYQGTAQTLAGVLVRLRVAERHLTEGTDATVEELRAEIVHALEEIRGVARRLRPPELDELGARVALEAHARSLTQGSRMDVQFEGTLPALSREATLALFRIVQEAITNVVVHARADTLRIRFRTENGVVVAEVEDDGAGFDPGQALAHSGTSLGLFGMHERAGYVQGELSVHSGPGRGTLVRVRIPTAAAPSHPSPDLERTADRLVEGLAHV